ncbi:hypothetical protein LGM90_12645 [Burkholderia sp. AU28942]|uniref:hypothetical protein n=1 Tax=Burkholderia TaxID=32008 RepID=UPI000841544E|nr:MULTISPECIES: hypothetical protein [Burkholderia]AOK04457.1 hypothetical protein WK25_08255 [Burkholderia latens]MCA8309362.1 hypothetical protein [Burkholderia sp. AU28942]
MLPDVAKCPAATASTVAARCVRCRRGTACPSSCSRRNDDDASIARAFDAGATDFVSEPIRWKLPGYRIRYLLRVSGIGLLQRAKALRGHREDFAVQLRRRAIDRRRPWRRPGPKLLIKPSDVALLHKHIVESFQRFEHDLLHHGIGVGAGRLGSHRTPFRAVDAPEPRERA